MITIIHISEEKFHELVHKLFPGKPRDGLTASELRKVVESLLGRSLIDNVWNEVCPCKVDAMSFLEYRDTIYDLQRGGFIDSASEGSKRRRTPRSKPAKSFPDPPPFWDEKNSRLIERYETSALCLRVYLGLKKTLAPNKFESWFRSMCPKPRLGFIAVSIPYFDEQGESKDFPIQVVPDHLRFSYPKNILKHLRAVEKHAKNQAGMKSTSPAEKQWQKLFELKIAAQDMTEYSGWTEAEAILFILSNKEPYLPHIAVTEQKRAYPSDTETGAVVIQIEDMTIAASSVRDLYSEIQKEALVGKIRPARVRTKAAARAERLIKFVQENREMPWAERESLWNNQVAKEDMYKPGSMKVSYYKSKSKFLPKLTDPRANLGTSSQEKKWLEKFLDWIDEQDALIDRIIQKQNQEGSGD